MPSTTGLRLGDWPYQNTVVCMAILVVSAMSSGLAGTALLRLLESDVCRDYYLRIDSTLIAPDDSIAEMKCKGAAVQASLSGLLSVGTIAATVPALFAALIFLVVSRVMDKRLLLLLNVTGTICENLFFTTVLYCYNTLDLRFLWLNGLFAFLGGGSVVFGAVVQAMLAESVPIQYLTSFYLFAQAAVTATSLLSSFLGLYLMQQNLWLPVGLGAVLLTLVIPLLTFFRVDEASMDQFPDHGEIPSNGHSPKDVSLKEACTSAWERFSQSGASMKSMRLFMAVMFAHVIGDSFRSILSLWMSKRYGWTIREVGYLLLAGAVFQVLLLPVLPWVLGFKRFHLDREGSLRLVRRSIIFSIAGSFMIGCSWNVVVIGISLIVCTFGVGFADGLHSCLAAGLEKRDISQVFICMSIVRMLGGALGAFVTGKLYGFSAGRENIWLMGLPMWVCTIMFILAALLSRRLQ